MAALAVVDEVAGAALQRSEVRNVRVRLLERVSLLDGTSDFSTGMVVVVGSDATNDTISVTIDALTSTDLGVNASDISTQAGATTAITALDTAIDTVSTARARRTFSGSRSTASGSAFSRMT